MVDERSALAAVYEEGWVGVADGPTPVDLFERRARGLVQIAGWHDHFAAVCRRLEGRMGFAVPDEGRRATTADDRVLFRVGPERLWLAGPRDASLAGQLEAALPADDAVVTDLGHSRTVLRLQGPGRRLLLNRGLPIDLDESVFPDNAFAQSVVYHIPLLVHHVKLPGGGAFDLYVPQDFAASFWGWLLDAAASLGCAVGAPR